MNNSQSFPVTLDALPQLLRWIRSYPSRLTERKKKQVELILEELFVNIVCYSGLDGKAFIKLSLEEDNRGLTIKVIDAGIAFDPTEYKATLPEEMENSPIGGVGIHLVKNLVDGLFYKREGNENVLKLLILFE